MQHTQGILAWQLDIQQRIEKLGKDLQQGQHDLDHTESNKLSTQASALSACRQEAKDVAERAQALDIVMRRELDELNIDDIDRFYRNDAGIDDTSVTSARAQMHAALRDAFDTAAAIREKAGEILRIEEEDARTAKERAAAEEQRAKDQLRREEEARRRRAQLEAEEEAQAKIRLQAEEKARHRQEQMEREACAREQNRLEELERQASYNRFGGFLFIVMTLAALILYWYRHWR